MASVNALNEIGGNLISSMMGSILWIGVIFILIGIVGFIMWWFLVYKKKFDIEVKVISERSDDQNKVIWDKAAIIKDRKTGTKFFKLWIMKAELPIPKFNVMQSTTRGDYLEIYRKTDDEFYFLFPATINKTYIVKMDGKLYPIAEQEHKQIDADIAYWNVKRKDRNKSIFSQDTMMMKLLPYVPLLLGGVILIFILYILMNNLPSILNSLKELTAELKSYKQAQLVTVKLIQALI